MTPCLLCLSPAVADGLCVADGARLWAARARSSYPEASRAALVNHDLGHCKMQEEQASALREIRTFTLADVFIARVAAARAERERAEDERIRRRDGAV